MKEISRFVWSLLLFWNGYNAIYQSCVNKNYVFGMIAALAAGLCFFSLKEEN